MNFIFNSKTEVLEESRSAYVLDVCRKRAATNTLVLTNSTIFKRFNEIAFKTFSAIVQLVGLDNEKHIYELLAAGNITKDEIAKAVGCVVTTTYRVAKGI